MNDELVRCVVGLPVALLVPLSIPALRARRAVRVGASALLALVVVLGVDDLWKAIVLGGATLAAAAVAVPGTEARSYDVRSSIGAAFRVPGVLAGLALLALAAVVVDAGAAADGVEQALASDEAITIAALGLAAVFVAGSAVAALLTPLTARLARSEDVASLASAGTYIGWLERTVFFACIVGGSPEAAAIALTAKSVARFPTFPRHEEGFAEYVLIGSLASLIAAAAPALVARAVLGLPAF